MSFPRYPRYKESGVEWLGEVPQHWELRRLGFLADERREKVSDRDFAAISVTKQGLVPQLETAAKTDDGDNRRLVRKGDFVINSRSDRRGSAGVAPMDGSVSLINTVLALRNSLVAAYAHHLLRSVVFQEEFYRFGKGIVADLWSTNFSEMKDILIPIPTPAEQRAIAAFLDRETAKIDALIAEQEKLIELLAEKRQAVISHAVTKGLNPDAPMKPSGLEWLGDVPAHWEVKRLKSMVRSIEQGWSPQCEGEPVDSAAEWGVLKAGCTNGGVFRPEENKRLPAHLEPLPALGVKRGDLLVSRANTIDLVGSAAVVPDDFPRLLLCDKLYRLRFDAELVKPEFICRLLCSSAVRSQIELRATGASASMLNIGQSVILELPVPVPAIGTQRLIVAELDAATGRIDTLVAQAESAITLLRERRAALISAAVTGQIDARDLSPEPVA